jgi:putative adenylate-forming enzyme
MIERLRRLPEAVRTLRVAREFEAHDEWSVERLRAYQRERLLTIVRHAAANSPYYRERFAGIELSNDLDLGALPRLDKATRLEHFDELVTDRRLTLAGLERHLTELEGADSRTDPMLFGEYRAMASGGTSGRRGVFVYGRAEWRETLAGLVNCWSAYCDFAPRLPRRRLAAITADSLLHMGGRWNRSVDVGLNRLLRLDARAPIGDLVEALNAFRPEGINTYASIAALLAERQLGGELRIAPRVIVTGGEVLTAEMKERIGAAFGQPPFNGYGASETGYIAFECDHHAGLHVFEDQVLIEVVDGEYRPVSPGEPGTRLLITNLFNRTQPLIRYELNDLLTVSPNPCPCGRPSRLLEKVEGRSDDVLEMPATEGGTIKVHPVTLRSPLAGVGALSEYRIVYGAGELRVDAVLTGADGRQACGEIETGLRAALAKRGVQVPPILVESVAEIPRHPRSGKHKAIEVQGA